MASKFLEFPFAVLGDLKEIPQDTDRLGTVSKKTGYGANYSLNIKDKPNEALRVERIFMNALFNSTETLLQEWQRHGASQWYATAPSGKQIAYDEGALVYHTRAIWQSQVANNLSEPSTDDSKWKKIRPFSEEDMNTLLNKRNFAEREKANTFKEENKFAKAITVGNANLTSEGDIKGGLWGKNGLKETVENKAPLDHTHNVLDLENVAKLARVDKSNTFEEQVNFKKNIKANYIISEADLQAGNGAATFGRGGDIYAPSVWKDRWGVGDGWAWAGIEARIQQVTNGGNIVRGVRLGGRYWVDGYRDWRHDFLGTDPTCQVMVGWTTKGNIAGNHGGSGNTMDGGFFATLQHFMNGGWTNIWSF